MFFPNPSDRSQVILNRQETKAYNEYHALLDDGRSCADAEWVVRCRYRRSLVSDAALNWIVR